MIRLTPLCICVAASLASAADQPHPAGRLELVSYTSPADSTEQPAYFQSAPGDHPRPLLVGLHQWSASFRNSSHVPRYGEWCERNGWHAILPDFRGPNFTPDATGSDLVVSDIVAATNYARSRVKVDPDRVYLVGASGGGFAALLLAGRAPEQWSAVSAWVPITDLRAWHSETKRAGRKYWRDIEASCGGPPGASEDVDREYTRRSPITHLAAARGLPVEIAVGINDGHSGSVPASHSIRAFNLLAGPGKRVPLAAMRSIVDERVVPEPLRFAEEDPDFGEKRVLMRRESNRARLTVFDGGHEIVFEAAMGWLAEQRRATGELPTR